MAPRKPDLQRQADMEQARKLREAKQSTLDSAVKRAHEAGGTVAEIAAELGKRDSAVIGSLKRQGLTPNAPVTLTPKQTLGQKAAHRRRRG